MAASDLRVQPRHLKIVSLNMHGFNQGFAAIDEMIKSLKPDVFLCQEHWLTPADLHKFHDHFNSYFAFGSSAVSNEIDTGILRGRPFGGLMSLIRNDLHYLTKTIHSEDRFSVIKLANFLIINVYLPCVGTRDRVLTCEDILENVWAWRERHPGCDCVIAENFNADLNSCNDDVANYVNSFITIHGLSRCDSSTVYEGQPTYVNFALNHQSCIDFVLTSNAKNTVNFEILDPHLNFSDHFPVAVSLVCSVPIESNSINITNKSHPTQFYLRWDKADNNSYYFYTGEQRTSSVYLYTLDNALKSPENILLSYWMGLILYIMK